ncbi:hypothetical protein NDU88_001305 [Pleurodeles waltl]|uniref:Uncharacterized protein n=1 Tax=Pleurodeles waltl TaxID=8319 RepID=A0AAV7LY90_PLEWA|nr:hypothetical protein NDU88_001305 [Pleurodeles waltl]
MTTHIGSRACAHTRQFPDVTLLRRTRAVMPLPPHHGAEGTVPSVPAKEVNRLFVVARLALALSRTLSKSYSTSPDFIRAAAECGPAQECERAVRYSNLEAILGSFWALFGRA